MPSLPSPYLLSSCSAIRRRRPGKVGDNPNLGQPVTFVHSNETTKSSIARVHRHLPATEVPQLLEKRFQIINLWRPINNPAFDWPLALGDWQSVSPERDTFPLALVFPDSESETMLVKYSPDIKFKYYYGMTPEEFVLFKG
jgi:hypothetical protein